MNPSGLSGESCRPCRGEEGALTAKDLSDLRKQVPEWTLEDARLSRAFRFRDYRETLAFVDQVARIAEEQDHHPDVTFGYNNCTVTWWTHSVNGLSRNDFICAAKVNDAVDRD